MNTTEVDTTTNQTTYVCLFHTAAQAEAAVEDLTQAGIPKSAIGIMGNSGTSAANPAAMEKWRVPKRDAQHLLEAINKGGTVVAVSGHDGVSSRIEAVFQRNQASQIDETVAETKQTVVASPLLAKPAAVAQDQGTINVIEEELHVGKRQVQTGGVRIYQRMVEKPVTETVSLQEEHVTVERHAVNRPISAADHSMFEGKSFEVTTTGEEAVVSKTARIVEEISIGKETSEHIERIQDTVRHTEVTVEQTSPETQKNRKPKK